MSEIEIISKKLFEYSGSGRVLYVNGSEFDVNFSLQMLQNGKINGELYFHFQENNYPRLLECLKNIVALYSLWLFGHFLLVVAITSVGVGLGYITSSEHGLALTYSEQWLVCGSVALSLGAQGILHLSSAYYYLYAGSTQDYRGSRKWATYRIISAV
jgi:low temperature requirement protein LtrA